MKTTAAVLHTAGDALELLRVTLGDPGPDQVLVRVRATGVCASDLHIVEGRLPKPLPIVPGHEAAGEVVGIGPGVADLRVGARVVLSILPRCSACPACRSGRTAHCSWGSGLATTGTLDGTSTAWTLPDGAPLHHFNGVSSFSEYVVVPRSGAVEVDPALPYSTAALLGCAVMTGVGAVRNAARVAPGQTVAVIGCGGVGLNVVQGARMAGAARIVAVDVDDAKLALARRVGATDTVDARDLEVPAAVERLVPGGVDHAFDAIGRPAALQDAYAVLAGGGTAVAVGLYAVDDTITLPAFPLIGERRIVGTYLGGADPHLDIPLLATDVLTGALRLDELIVERPFAEVNEAIDDLRHGRSLARQVLTFEE
jgi:S-(hydroxymethyl)glutathione dehydrogenase / alcohol dehydrogenase